MQYLLHKQVVLIGLVSLIHCTSPKTEKSIVFEHVPKSFGNVVGLASSDSIITVFHRGETIWSYPLPTKTITSQTIISLDNTNGEVILSFGEGLYSLPHGLHKDDSGAFWTTDVSRHQVFKLNSSNEILMELGEAYKAGNESSTFNMPTDIAVNSKNDILVSDGYGNCRIVVFNDNGEFKFEFGKCGSGNGEFNTPHGLALDSNDEIYVADRENNRVQKFTANGDHLVTWTNPEGMQLYSVTYHEGYLYAIDYTFDEITNQPIGSSIIKLDTNLTFIDRISERDGKEGKKHRFHDIEVVDGNIYVGDIAHNALVKVSLNIFDN
jgi:peptidylamidoglycolate lyase